MLCIKKNELWFVFVMRLWGLFSNRINNFFAFFSLQKSFENVFSIPFFIQFLVSGAILCVTVFQIVMVYKPLIYIRRLWTQFFLYKLFVRFFCCCNLFSDESSQWNCEFRFLFELFYDIIHGNIPTLLFRYGATAEKCPTNYRYLLIELDRPADLLPKSDGHFYGIHKIAQIFDSR